MQDNSVESEKQMQMQGNEEKGQKGEEVEDQGPDGVFPWLHRWLCHLLQKKECSTHRSLELRGHNCQHYSWSYVIQLEIYILRTAIYFYFGWNLGWNMMTNVKWLCNRLLQVFGSGKDQPNSPEIQFSSVTQRDTEDKVVVIYFFPFVSKKILFKAKYHRC